MARCRLVKSRGLLEVEEQDDVVQVSDMVDPNSVITILEMANWADDPAGGAAENTDATP